MIVERTQYFAKPGNVETVLDIRRRASAVRREIGLASGRILARVGGDDGGPDVSWEASFHDKAAHDADLAARAASAEFTAIRKEMRAAIDDFRREVLELDDQPIANGMRPVDMALSDVAPREVVFPSAGRDLKGYLYTPPGDGPFPCMICNHGSTIDKGTLDVSRPGTAALLASWGIASFLPHRRGYGNSPGPSWREEAPAEFGSDEYDAQIVARLNAESDDVIAALGCVAAMREIDDNHIGVMGSSFGGINTLLAASKSSRFSCAIDFAGAAMNWDRAPRLRQFMTEAGRKVVMPLFLLQAANDYSIRPTLELADALKGKDGRVVWSRIFPIFGVTPMEGHLLEGRGAMFWEEDVHRFLERYL